MAKKKKAEGDTGKKGGKRKLFMIVGLVVVLGAGAFFGMKMFAGSDAEAGVTPSESEPPAEGEVIEVASLTTNVSGSANLARVGLAIVTSEGAATATVEAKFPLLKDAAVSELARSEAETLRTAEGADDLRKRLTRRAKKIYPDGEVLRVLLTELVVQ